MKFTEGLNIGKDQWHTACPGYGMNWIRQERAKEILTAIFKSNEAVICEYAPDTDEFTIFDEKMRVKQEFADYLDYLDHHTIVHPEDRQKFRKLLLGQVNEKIEIRVKKGDDWARLLIRRLELDEKEECGGVRIPFMVSDITEEKNRERNLEEQASRDSLTSLYNYSYGRKLVDEYLQNMDPYATCGMMVIDIDYFKYVNDTFGHLFGDYALTELARLLREFFYEKDIVMRFGGDEFVIFLKDISHADLVKKGMQLIYAIRALKFEGRDYSMTCSIGICYLPENEAGYTYDQLFGNADWALYQAKENGRDRYVFCDNLRRFEMVEETLPADKTIDVRYLHNDIISTAFEVFEKTNSFKAAIEQLMEIIGYRFRLDRITVIHTDIQKKNTGRQYQWTSEYAPEVLEKKAEFTKEDFLTLFRSYDEYQTVVLQHDNMSAYSRQGAELLMQGGAKTVMYAAMYCEGKYTGAISYVSCREKRYWTRQERKDLGEVTKLISAHLARAQAINEIRSDLLNGPEYDSLTGLISFSRFHVELERLIIGNYATSDYLLYMDIAGFKYFNQKYGYHRGDRILRELCGYFIENLQNKEGVYFTRVVSDQFLMLLPSKNQGDIVNELKRLCEGFAELESKRVKGYRPRLRVGIYQIEQDCPGASYAIDAANYARKQTAGNAGSPVRIYDEGLGKQRQLENAIVNEIGDAIREGRFMIYLQPKISLENGAVIGAEALARWRMKDGRIISPAQFIPLCESTGQIEELDFYIFEQTVKFLQKNQRMGRKQVPISVNISILHAANEHAAERFLSILKKYNVEPKYIEIELTETATVKEYNEAKRLFRQFQDMGIHTAIDDFGAGYSVLNSIIDIPVNTMKLDRIFINNCNSGTRGVFFLKSVIEMIRGLGYHVICEGVETEDQVRLLQEADCAEVQGFLFSKPLPIEEYEAMVYPDQKE